ncbi:hypothetical protein [Longimicrobium sp.]|uniref:hypothetical protein n=1 Tax=Longimicrobium sp. TaxID=2029185 RepID=UPI002CC18A32|nr:hypothetical protein [Longimicrobium sp.]HSU12904.1 hypothetical protein [Longimicrobium sp.]
MRAIGFHGTSVERAERILAAGFRASRNDYDWLGDGVYFFQDAPGRAREWAAERFGSEAAVVGAEIDLTDCLDLLDPRWHRVIANAHRDLVARGERLQQPLPRQTTGARRLDRAVINYAVDLMADDGLVIRSVRGAFEEGPPIFPGSALRTRSHVQIAVRDSSALMRIWLEGGADARS